MPGGLNGPPVLQGPQYVYPSKTLAALRDDLLTMLGFPDPLTGADSQTRTLLQLRETIIRRCNFHYIFGANPPGLDQLVDSFINEAQQTVFRTVEFDKGGIAFPPLMVADTDATQIDYQPVFLLALGLAKSHYQQTDAKAYFEQFSKYLTDRTVRRPPKIVGMATQWIILAQRQLYHRYKMLRTERWWSIPIIPPDRIYDVPYDASSELDFRYASQVWLQDDDRWLQLRSGINPASFGNTTPTIPTRFEFREFFEIFPTPDKTYTAWIKGHRGLLPFSSDTDVTTIDHELILLQALIWGKAHFNQRDAAIYKNDLDIWIGRLNAGRFAGQRFIPGGTRDDGIALPFPTATFPRG